MSVSLSFTDLARLEAASRALLSPLTAPDLETWRSEVLAAFRELLWVDHTLFAIPLGRGLDYFSPDMDPASLNRFDSYIHEPQPGVLGSIDPALDLWFARRRSSRLGLYSDAMMDTVTDFRYTRSDFYQDVVQGARMFDHQGFSVDLPTGEALMCLSYSQKSTARPPWDRVTVLRSLGPSLQTGLATLLRLDAHRAALDAVNEPLAAFGADGRELHRNAALRDLLVQDTEAAQIEWEMIRLAVEMRRVAFPLRHDAASLPKPTRRMTTSHATYTLRGAILPPGAFTTTESFMVTVQTEGAKPALPSAETLRERFGLTKREAETTLLVAQGLSNDEIAERMFVSRHTVRHHVESLMAKLDLTGRGREAVAARLLSLGPALV